MFWLNMLMHEKKKDACFSWLWFRMLVRSVLSLPKTMVWKETGRLVMTLLISGNTLVENGGRERSGLLSHELNIKSWETYECSNTLTATINAAFSPGEDRAANRLYSWVMLCSGFSSSSSFRLELGDWEKK